MQRLPSKFLILAFGFLILAFGFSGCANKEEAKKTITIWHWMTDREPAFKELSLRYEAETGIKPNFELYAPSDAYSQKVRAAAQGANLPDIFGILATKRDFASFIKAGYILNLTSYMNENNNKWRNSLFSKALAVNEFCEGNSYGIDPGIYGAPIDIMTIQMVYNRSLLKKLGFNPRKPPNTFQELLDVFAKISAVNREEKGAKLEGIVSGWGEVWMIDCFANNYAFNIMGEDKVIATIKGEVPYTDQDWIKVLNLFKDMRDTGILANGIITMVNKTAEQLFATEKAVFAFNGSWCVNVYREMNPKLDYGVMLPPKASENFALSIWGGAGSSFMVNAKSPNKEEAVKFLELLTSSPQQAYLSETTNNLPANKECLNKIPEVLAQFARGMESATHPNVWGVSEFPQVIEAWDKGIQSIIIGEKTPEQVASEVQKIKERELAKKR